MFAAKVYNFNRYDSLLSVIKLVDVCSMQICIVPNEAGG